MSDNKPALAIPRVTPKQFNGFVRSESKGLDCVGFNDGWNMQNFGITKAQCDALRTVCDSLNGGPSGLKAADINRALAGEKVCLTYLQPEEIQKVREAFKK